MFVQIKRRQAANRKIKKRSEQFTEYDGKKKKNAASLVPEKCKTVI